MKIMYELKRIRSAKAPVIKAGVITANFNWNMANNTRGIVGASFHLAFPSIPFIIKKVQAGCYEEHERGSRKHPCRIPGIYFIISNSNCFNRRKNKRKRYD